MANTSSSGLLGDEPALSQGSSVSEIASSPHLYYAKINVACPFVHSINNGTDMSIVFCEFSLFVNIKHFANIRDNKLNQAFLIYFLYTEKLRQTEVQ